MVLTNTQEISNSNNSLDIHIKKLSELLFMSKELPNIHEKYISLLLKKYNDKEVEYFSNMLVQLMDYYKYSLYLLNDNSRKEEIQGLLDNSLNSQKRHYSSLLSRHTDDEINTLFNEWMEELSNSLSAEALFTRLCEEGKIFFERGKYQKSANKCEEFIYFYKKVHDPDIFLKMYYEDVLDRLNRCKEVLNIHNNIKNNNLKKKEDVNKPIDDNIISDSIKFISSTDRSLKRSLSTNSNENNISSNSSNPYASFDILSRHKRPKYSYMNLDKGESSSPKR